MQINTCQYSIVYNLIFILKNIFDKIVNKLKKELLKMSDLNRLIKEEKFLVSQLLRLKLHKKVED